MNTPAWFVEHKNTLRLVILTVLIASMLGPWMFDLINVPAEYDCDKPFVRLEGDYCGVPVPGFQFFELLVGGFFYMILELISGTFVNRSRELLVGLSILPLIPFFTSLLIVWKKETRRLRTLNLIAWTLAFLLTLTLFILQIKDQAIQLWGLWLYIIVAISALTFEMFIQKGKGKKANGT